MNLARWALGPLLAASLLLPAMPESAIARSSRGSRSHSTSTHSGSRVHVKGYYRKDGTYVAPHDRSAPGGSHYSGSYSTRHYTTHSYHTIAPAHWHSGGSRGWGNGHHPSKNWYYTLQRRDSHGRFTRSTEAKDAFKRKHPCPSTGRPSGPCPGYVIDHVRALKRGGGDDPGNMQWQTVAEAKAKDRWE
jgi:hypothetical protein